ncbi:hypothetical protein MNBD_BACTEROID07-2021 [hydrothermal vent metagenome]|uniref:Uncharacterized protein n=1 Tax=hydrothermal vent metagenome TaxID=652676 RepID=A0A3B0UVT9_9ZZZZ
MSPRPKRRRMLSEPPSVSGFVPESGEYSSASEDKVVLLFEEYEAIRLADYECLTQLEASKRMYISRPTFTRIYESARKKVAKAFVENKRLSIEGGQVEFKADWYRCENCGSVFKRKSGKKASRCPVCGDDNVIPLQQAVNNFSEKFGGAGRGGGRFRGGRGVAGFCICPKCDEKVEHVAGVPCGSLLCPHCNIRMVREDSEHYQFILNKRKK